MEKKKLGYFIYLVLLHCAGMLITISKFMFPKWGAWLTDTHFLATPFSVYVVVIVAIVPLLSVIPYFFQHDFPNVPAKKKLALAALIVGNCLLILTYTAVISKVMA